MLKNILYSMLCVICIYLCHMNYECGKRNYITIYYKSYIIMLPEFWTIILLILIESHLNN